MKTDLLSVGIFSESLLVPSDPNRDIYRAGRTAVCGLWLLILTQRSVLGSIQNAHASEDCAKNSMPFFVSARQDRATQSSNASSVSNSTFRF
jgi:hypothetical protein